MNSEKIISRARKAYPNAANDTEALVLLVAAVDYHRAERLAALNLNARQARTIANLSEQIAAMATELDDLRREAGR